MRVLAVPNWSFGRDRRLLADCRDLLAEHPVSLHFCESDIDHNRTVTAFSGPFDAVEAALFELCALILPSIDLNRHVGVHPRIGALDVCPFIPLEPPKTKLRAQRLKESIEGTAQTIAQQYDLPVFLYEKSEKGRHEADLPTLRKGGFGGLLDRVLEPDFGPNRAHTHLGATIMGWRDFLIAMNVNLRIADPIPARRIADRIRQLRTNGDPRMLGVRALGFPLASREMSQVSMNLTLPDLTPVDPILDYVTTVADSLGAEVAYYELIGVIRSVDMESAGKLHPRPEQIVPTGVKV